MSTPQSFEDLKTKFASQRVRFVGTFGNADGPTGKVWRVTTRGVWVTFSDGHRELLHPEDLQLVVPAD